MESKNSVTERFP